MHSVAYERGGRAVNRLIQTLVFASCWMLTAESGVRSEDVDRALRERFLRAVPQTERIVGQISFRAKVVSTAVPESVSDSVKAQYRQHGVDYDKPRVAEVNCSLRGTFGLTTEVGRGGIESVAARNGDYAFRISRATTVKSYTLGLLATTGG